MNTTARVQITITNESGNSADITINSVELEGLTADRLGQLIGYAANGVEHAVVPGMLVDGITETLAAGSMTCDGIATTSRPISDVLADAVDRLKSAHEAYRKNDETGLN